MTTCKAWRRVPVLCLAALSLSSEPTWSQQEDVLFNLSHGTAEGDAWQAIDRRIDDTAGERSGELMLTASYGHTLNARGTRLFYGADWSRLRGNGDESTIESGRSSDGGESRLPATDGSTELPRFEARLPQEHSRGGVSIGLTTRLSPTRLWHHQIRYSVSQVNDEPLRGRNTVVSGSSYVETQPNAAWRYGLGVQIDRAQDDVSLLPLVGLTWQAGDYGAELLLPSRARLWRTWGARRYLDLSVDFDEHAFALADTVDAESTVVGLTEFTAGVSYHYLWQDAIRLTLGLQLPSREYEIERSGETRKYTQDVALGVVLGISIVTSRGAWR